MKKIIYILALLGLCVEHACAEYAYECAIDGEGQDMTFSSDSSTWVQYEEDQANGDKCFWYVNNDLYARRFSVPMPKHRHTGGCCQQ